MMHSSLFRAMQGLGAGGLDGRAHGDHRRHRLAPPAGPLPGLHGRRLRARQRRRTRYRRLLHRDVSWRWIFYINVPIGDRGAVRDQSGPASLPGPVHLASIDCLGSSFLAAGVSALILMTTWGGTQYAWDSLLIVALDPRQVVMLAGSSWPSGGSPSRFSPSAVPHPGLQRRQRRRFRDRLRDVRRDHLPAAVSAAGGWRKRNQSGLN